MFFTFSHSSLRKVLWEKSSLIKTFLPFAFFGFFKIFCLFLEVKGSTYYCSGFSWILIVAFFLFPECSFYHNESLFSAISGLSLISDWNSSSHSSHNHVHNILRLWWLSKFSFHLKWNKVWLLIINCHIRVATRFAERLKT